MAVIAIEHDLIVITDEVYEHLVFDEPRGARAAGDAARDVGADADAVERGQELLVHRLEGRLGDRAGRRWSARCCAAKQWLTFTSGSPLQPAVAHALDHEPDFPAALARSLQSRRDLLVAGLADAGLAAYVPEGTYFATTDISHLGWEDGMSFCRALPELAGVVAIPNQAFYDDKDAGRHLVRWAFCKEPDVITEGVRRLAGVDLSR